MTVESRGAFRLARNWVRICPTHVRKRVPTGWWQQEKGWQPLWCACNDVKVMCYYRMFFQILFPFSCSVCYLSTWFIIVSSIRCLTSVALDTALLMQSWSCSAVRGLPPVYKGIQLQENTVRYFVYSSHMFSLYKIMWSALNSVQVNLLLFYLLTWCQVFQEWPIFNLHLKLHLSSNKE